MNDQHPDRAIRVLVVAHQASEKGGGAGALPLRLFGRLRARGVEAWLVTHDSTRTELGGLLPANELSRVVFVPSLPGFARVFTWGKSLPSGSRTIAWWITQLERQIAMVPVVRRLVRDLAIDVVHQPLSVSPVTPSPLARLGVPVVMGPLIGGMELPPAFRNRDSGLAALVKKARPPVARAMNRVIRGRLRADVLLVADERTRSLLPVRARQHAVTATIIGVELGAWPAPDGQPGHGARPYPADPTRFLFTGRLVDWKGVDILLESFARAAQQVPARLDIVGDGPERARLQAQASRLGCAESVRFLGWRDPSGCARCLQACDVFLSAALLECGGIAVLEAMASGRPVIATAWGGHLDTVDPAAGILVDVSSPDALVDGLASAMVRLAADPELRWRMGAAGRRLVEERYDWDKLADQRLRIYHQAVRGYAGNSTRARRRQGTPSASL